jgi:hypothetical protein
VLELGQRGGAGERNEVAERREGGFPRRQVASRLRAAKVSSPPTARRGPSTFREAISTRVAGEGIVSRQTTT